MGSDKTYPEEGPSREITVKSFDINAAEITNAQFSKFVEETGYVTDAEKPQEGFGAPGGAVFAMPSSGNPNGWHFKEGANWRSPEGGESTIKGFDSDPVVQVTLNDARAYAIWAGRRLPTEAEWEYAARGGSTGLYVWGDEKSPGGVEKANHWQGAFPYKNTVTDGYAGRSPIGCFEPNGFGLYDMIGNVWELTDTPYQDGLEEPVYTIKGGSFLCADNYCRRYRAPARQPQEAGLSTNHIGFRTVKDIAD